VRRSRSISIVTLVLGVAFAVAACLPASIRPTPTPSPTPTPGPTLPPPPTPTPGPPTPTPGPSFELHTVGKGDTLTSLARKYKTSGRSIAYWNRDTYPSLDPESAKYNPNALKRGWVLKILPGEEYEPPPDDGESGEQVTPEPEESDDPGASPVASEEAAG
jgi:hypothetical protein